MDSSQVTSKLKGGPIWEGAANPPVSDRIQPSWCTSFRKRCLHEAQWLKEKHRMPCKFSNSRPSIQKVMWLITMASQSPWSRSRGCTRVSFSPTSPGSLATAGLHSFLYCRRTQSWVDLYQCLHRCSRSNCIHPTPGLAPQHCHFCSLLLDVKGAGAVPDRSTIYHPYSQNLLLFTDS